MDRQTIKKTIIEQYRNVIVLEAPEDVKEVLTLWVENELEKLILSTADIKKDDVRVKSIVMLFNKRFEKARRLASVLNGHGLINNTALFTELLNIL